LFFQNPTVLKNALKIRFSQILTQKYPHETSIFHVDIIEGCEKFGDFIVNVVEVSFGIQRKKSIVC
jgi:hypothetical protein